MGHFYFARDLDRLCGIVENKICGATDIGLTENGRQQARELGQKILDEQIHIDEILYSPLSEGGGYGAICVGDYRDSGAGGTKADGTEFWQI
ncbi:MAG: phosphoglycerate mutase family protein [Roseburia sp.]